MALRDLSRECVLATVVHLLETTLIRIGNADYATPEQELRPDHAPASRMSRSRAPPSASNFMGKSGNRGSLGCPTGGWRSRPRACQELPGQQLFQYLDADGDPTGVSSDRRASTPIRAISPARDITAKHFLTWAGTVLAAAALQEFDEYRTNRQRPPNATSKLRSSGWRPPGLATPPTICRKCYIHPEVINSYLAGDLAANLKRAIDRELSRHLSGLKPEEAAVLALLERRLKTSLTDKLKASVASRSAA